MEMVYADGKSKKLYSVWIDVELLNSFKKLAKDKNISQSVAMEEILTLFIKNNQKGENK